MRKLAFFIAMISLICLQLPAFGWGREGHRMIAELAMRKLTPAAKQKVLILLGGMSPEDAATWMDDVRDDHSYDYMKPWHYINIEKGESYQPGGNNIVTALAKAYSELLNVEKLKPEQAKQDMLILFHLMGDLMQPLHCGYGSDKGGNTVQLQYKGKGTNLHHLWDSEIIEYGGITAADFYNTAEHPISTEQPAMIDGELDIFQAMAFSRDRLS